MDNVLIADEDAQFLETLQNGLNRIRQFNVFVASDMASVAAALSEHRIAVLVTGLGSSGFDCLSLLSHMSRNHPITPCIVMTDRGKPWFKSRLGQQSFLYYQEKPFDIGSLTSSVIVGLNLCDLGTNIEGLTMVSLMPLMAMLNRSCRIAVSTDDKQTGEIFFRDGVLLDARCNGQEGEAAARRMAVWNRIAFEIDDLPDDMPRKIETDLMEIADATWNKEAAMAAAGGGAKPHVMEDDVIVLEDVVSGDEADTSGEDAILLSEVVPDGTGAAEGNGDREAAEQLVQKLVLDIRQVKGYQGVAIFDMTGDILSADRPVEDLNLAHLAREMSRFCNEAQAAVDRMRLDAADALTLHTRGGIVLVQRFLSEAGTPLCALIHCSAQGNWYYFKVRLENLMRASAAAA